MSSNEEALLEALIRSGIPVEPDKRYTYEEVCEIVASKRDAKPKHKHTLPQHAVASLLGMTRSSVSYHERKARATILKALAD